MAIIERPQGELAPAPVVTPTEAMGVFRRPTSTEGWMSWLTTIDHKRIGIMYGATALLFFVVGGVEALLIRIQLARPNNNVLSAGFYNELFTMHGTTMVFLVVMPMAAAFANYFIPLQIGARDVAFPRLNAFSYWTFLGGGIFLYLSWFLADAPDGGWFMYAPNSGVQFSPSHGIDFWALALIITGISSQVGAVNLIVTVLNMRAPGMTLMKMPIFTWMALVVQFLLLFAIPVITVALVLLSFDRLFDAQFFQVAAGADPLLWQHLFWIFGHPEVYILILPSFGIVSEVLPTFSRKPLFGYPFVVFSGVAIGFMGWGVWAHHMFASGLGPISVAAFSLSTMFIAVPTGVKIINWIATMAGGRLWFTTAMKFAIGLVTMFTIGGLSGVTHAVAPSDTQQTDTYYIVAHFHYVLFGGAIFGLFAGFYYWWPKVFGKMLSERLGSVNFWLMLLGFNLTFGPMHVLGLQGQPRRMYIYDTDMGFDFWNLVSTVGAFILALGVLAFLINVWVSRKGPAAPLDPWDARSLEWLSSNPPAPHNFDTIPTVHSLDEFFYRKYEEDEHGNLRKVNTAEELAAATVRDAHIHMPSPSYWPLVVSLGLPFIAGGLIFNYWISIFGLVLVLLGIYGWVMEPATAEDDGGDGGDHATHDKEIAPLADITSERTELAEHGIPGHDPAADAAHLDLHGMAHGSSGVSNTKLAMWLFLGSECLLFGGLISTYLLYRGQHQPGPAPDDVYDIPFTSVSSFVLLMSSLTMVLAVSAIARGDMRRCRLWLLTTALLGATFIGGQVYEFTAFYREGMGFTTSLFSSSFFTLTGFHGVHVTVGIVMLLSLYVLTIKGKVGPDRAESVEIVGLYWHFVDIVWIVIFTLVYLLPTLRSAPE